MYRKIAFMKSRNTFFSIRMRFDPFGSAYIFMQTHIVFEHTIVFISITKVAFAKYWHTTLLCYVYQNRLFNTFRSSSCLTSPCTFIRFRNGEWYSARASITSASCRFRFSFFSPFRIWYAKWFSIPFRQSSCHFIVVHRLQIGINRFKLTLLSFDSQQWTGLLK